MDILCLQTFKGNWKFESLCNFLISDLKYMSEYSESSNARIILVCQASLTPIHANCLHGSFLFLTNSQCPPKITNMFIPLLVNLGSNFVPFSRSWSGAFSWPWSWSYMFSSHLSFAFPSLSFTFTFSAFTFPFLLSPPAFSFSVAFGLLLFLTLP